MSRRTVLNTVLILLLVSLPAFVAIPFGPILGFDFHNLDAFHDCIARDNPYLSTGAACGDIWSRDMGYPPLLYWSFMWTRLLPLSIGVIVWAAVILVGVFVATLAWVPRGRRDGATIAFLALLLLQFPVLFAIERGNNDVLVLVLWTAAMALFAAGHPGGSGAIAGIATALKLYPAIAVVVVGGGLLGWAWRDRTAVRPTVRFAVGGVLALVIVLLVTIDQTQAFLADEFHRVLRLYSALSPSSHTLGTIAPWGISWLLSLPLLAVWVVASARRLSEDPIIVFAGSLAISTYFSPVSNDYNLITTYPLLMVLFVRSVAASANRLTFGLLVVGLIGIVSNRLFFIWSDLFMQAHVALQWLWLIATGVAVAVGRLHDAESSHAYGRRALLSLSHTPSTLVRP